MRKKALLVGARASFEGPWVNLEEGLWLVEPPSGVSICAQGVSVGAVTNGLLGGGFLVKGPCRVQAVVEPDYEGPEVCLSIEETK